MTAAYSHGLAVPDPGDTHLAALKFIGSDGYSPACAPTPVPRTTRTLNDVTCDACKNSALYERLSGSAAA